MDLLLTRFDFLETGIFGTLESADRSLFLFTLEHAYPVAPDGPASASQVFSPKIPEGVYTCKRGIHQLAHMPEPFETFEITGVEGHTNILFHSGNTNKDSEGCVLLGIERDKNTSIFHSRLAFEAFMNAQKGVDSFILTVTKGERL